MRFLIDSDWLIDALIGKPRAILLLGGFGDERLGVRIVSHCELLDGAFAGRSPAVRVAEARAFLGGFEALPITGAVVDHFARTRSHLRSQGRLIPDFDLVIAATALAHDLTLVTRNRRHFDRVAGLRLFEET